MIKLFINILYTLEMVTQQCQFLHLDNTSNEDTTRAPTHRPNPTRTLRQSSIEYEPYDVQKQLVKPIRRYWLLSDNQQFTKGNVQPRVYEDEKDTNIKQKIATLVEQTMHDTQRKMKLTDDMKEDYRENAPYRAGFILSMIKKSKDVLDELFNVAVKHKDEWMALEQLKIFELIVHTNVDTTNLLRQLVDIHVKYMNAAPETKRFLLI